MNETICRFYSTNLENMKKFFLSTMVFFLFWGCSERPYPKSDHFNGKTFFNPDSTYQKKSLWDVMHWRFTGERPEWKYKEVRTLERIPENTTRDSVKITWINHSTFFIQIDSFTILTDPVWSERVSPVSFAWPKRYHKPTVSLDELGRVDLVIISHNHYDHLDISTLDSLKKLYNPKILFPLGDEELMADAQLNNSRAMDWWQTEKLGPLTITFTPARHWSARGIFDRFASLWGSYRIDGGPKSLYFAGDTGYGPHFKQIREKMGPVDIAFLPIGAFQPVWFMQQNHMGPRQVLPAMEDLKAQHSLVMHMGTFKLGDDKQEEPKVLLDSLLQNTEDRMRITYPEAGTIYSF